MDFESGKAPSMVADAFVGHEMNEVAPAHQSLCQGLCRKQVSTGAACREHHKLPLFSGPVERHVQTV
jgi:hypothetical protein